MRLGVVPLLSGNSGGVYQYCRMVLEALRTPGTLEPNDTVVLFVHDPRDPLLSKISDPSWTILPLNPPTFRRKLGALARALPFGRSALDLLNGRTRQELPASQSPRTRPDLARWFKASGIDLMLYPVPMSISFEAGIPYIFAVHDLQHRLQPDFPEVGSSREWQSREYLFGNGIGQARAVVTDSETGRQDVLDCYGDKGISPESIFVLPYVPPTYLPDRIDQQERRRIRELYQLPERYFFYPAQFWPHKNHANLLKALALLRDHKGIAAPLVLCGSHHNAVRSQTFSDVMTLADSLGLSEQVSYLGFVPDGDMAALYAEAQALVMPTFFGPTNIPVLEAWSLGCPVLTSDLRGIREQAGDAALLADPHSPDSLCEALYLLWQDNARRSALIDAGRRRLQAYGPRDFAGRLRDVNLYAASCN